MCPNTKNITAMSSHFVIEKQGIEYTVSCNNTHTNITVVIINGNIVGEFTKLDDGSYAAKVINGSDSVPKDTYRMAEQYIIDQYFSVFRNARGLFKKQKQTKRRYGTPA